MAGHVPGARKNGTYAIGYLCMKTPCRFGIGYGRPPHSHTTGTVVLREIEGQGFRRGFSSNGYFLTHNSLFISPLQATMPHLYDGRRGGYRNGIPIIRSGIFLTNERVWFGISPLYRVHDQAEGNCNGETKYERTYKHVGGFGIRND